MFKLVQFCLRVHNNLNLRSGKQLSLHSTFCSNPCHTKATVLTTTTTDNNMVSHEEMTVLNDKLITVLQESFSQLHASIADQSKQSHKDLSAVTSTVKELEHSGSKDAKSASALGRMPSFSGIEHDALEFIEQFEYYATFCKWTDKDKLAAFPLALTGSARIWLLTLTETYDNFDQLKQLFNDRFLSKTDEWVLRKELSDRKQKLNESVMDYCADVMKRCQRLKIKAEDQMHKFIEGLLPELRDFVILREPKTLAEALNNAKIRETVKPASQLAVVTRSDLDQLQANMLNALSNVHSTVSNVNAPSFDKVRPQIRQDRIDSGIESMIKDQIRQELRRERFRTNPSHDNRPLRFTQNGGFGRPTRAVNGDPLCTICSKVGHTAARCYYNRSANRPNYGNPGRNPTSARPQRVSQIQLNSPGVQMNGRFVPQRR